MRRLSWAVQTAVIYTLTWFTALIPASVSSRIGAMAGQLIPRIVPKRLNIAVDNIERALPFMKSHVLWAPTASLDSGEIAQETFRNLGRSLMEICRLYHGRGVDVLANVELLGIENYVTAKAKGKGIIFLSGHCGNWELLALVLSSRLGEEISGIARRQDNPFLNRMVEQMRMRYKSRIIYKQGALKGILKALKRGNMVGILADQAVSPEEGSLIDVLGRKAWASKAPLVIARKSGAPVIPVFIHREEDRQIVTFYPEHIISEDLSDDGVQKDTQALSSYVENFMVSHPTQWYWVHRRWKLAGESVLQGV